jgi:hypothetical protein
LGVSGGLLVVGGGCVGGGCVVGGCEGGVTGGFGGSGGLAAGGGGATGGGAATHVGKLAAATNTVLPEGVCHKVPPDTNWRLRLPAGNPAGHCTCPPRWMQQSAASAACAVATSASTHGINAHRRNACVMAASLAGPNAAVARLACAPASGAALYLPARGAVKCATPRVIAAVVGEDA